MSWLDKYFTALAPSSATSTVQGLIQIAGDIAGTATSLVVQSITGVSGVANVTAADVRNSANAKLTFDTIPVSLATTDATANQTLQSFALGTTTGIYTIRSTITTTNSTGAISGRWDVDTTFQNNAGTLTQVANTGAAAVTNAYFQGGTLSATSVNVTFTGSNVLIRFTGVAATNLTTTSLGTLIKSVL